MKMQLIAKNPELDNVITFVFEPEQPLKWEPGQYLHYVLDNPNPDNRGIERWFTISSAPFEAKIQITTKFTDENGSTFKRALKALSIGDFIDADTPEGNFTLDTNAKKHIFIAGGIGITPYRSILSQLNHDGKKPNIELLYANSDENLVFADELDIFMNQNPNLHLKKFIAENHIPISLLQEYLRADGTVFYFSGPRKMVVDYRDKLLELGATKEQIKLDFFPGY